METTGILGGILVALNVIPNLSVERASLLFDVISVVMELEYHLNKVIELAQAGILAGV